MQLTVTRLFVIVLTSLAVVCRCNQNSYVPFISVGGVIESGTRSPLDIPDAEYVNYDALDTPLVARPGVAPVATSGDDESKNQPSSVGGDARKLLRTCPCMQPLNEALGEAIKAPTYYDRYHIVCEKYLEAAACMTLATSVGCGNKSFFDILTSGLSYACVEQRNAFTAELECIDSVSSSVTSSCNTHCSTAVKAAKALRTVQASFIISHEPVGLIGAPLNSDTVQTLLNNGCEVAACVLECTQKKFNEKCKNNTGNMITEFFVRPIAKGHDLPMIDTMSQFMTPFMPPPCNFAINSNELSKFRIDPSVDQQLRSMYSDVGKSPVATPQPPKSSPVIPEQPNSFVPPKFVSPLDSEFHKKDPVLANTNSTKNEINNPVNSTLTSKPQKSVENGRKSSQIFNSTTFAPKKIVSTTFPSTGPKSTTPPSTEPKIVPKKPITPQNESKPVKSAPTAFDKLPRFHGRPLIFTSDVESSLQKIFARKANRNMLKYVLVNPSKHRAKVVFVERSLIQAP